MKLLATAEHRSQVCHLTALSYPSSQSLNKHSVPGWHVATLHRYNSNYQRTHVVSLVTAISHLVVAWQYWSFQKCQI